MLGCSLLNDILRFDITISSKKLKFVYLHKRKYVEAALYPYFTMLGQSIGSIVLGTVYMHLIFTVFTN